MKQTEEFREAARCDEAGDHAAALKWLIAAAQKGEHSAYTVLGKRYLLGDRATLSPPAAIQLLQRGAEQGQADAALLLGVLSALGLHVEQNWNSALNYLVLAATQGSVDAQAQLALLSTDKKLASQRRGTAEYWVELARSIDLTFWLASSSPALLSDDPKIGLIPDLVPREICQWLIQKSRSKLARAMVYDAVSQKTITHHTRTNSAAVFGITETNVINTLIQAKIAASMQAPLRSLEATSVLHYDVGEEIANHFDFIDPKSPNYEEQIMQKGDRVVTFLIYLNDNYARGETEFPRLGIKHKGRRGEGLFFVNVTADGKPNLDTMHAGRPPAEGEKWIISQFIRNKSAF